MRVHRGVLDETSVKTSRIINCCNLFCCLSNPISPWLLVFVSPIRFPFLPIPLLTFLSSSCFLCYCLPSFSSVCLPLPQSLSIFHSILAQCSLSHPTHMPELPLILIIFLRWSFLANVHIVFTGIRWLCTTSSCSSLCALCTSDSGAKHLIPKLEVQFCCFGWLDTRFNEVCTKVEMVKRELREKCQ